MTIIVRRGPGGGGGSINEVVKEKSIYGSTQFVDGTPSINDEHCEGVYSFCQHGRQYYYCTIM